MATPVWKASSLHIQFSDDASDYVFQHSVVIRHINKVTLRWAWLVLGGWPSSGGYSTLVCNQPTRLTQPCIPPGLLSRVPALIGWGKGRNVTSARWQWYSHCVITYGTWVLVAMRLVANRYIPFTYWWACVYSRRYVCICVYREGRCENGSHSHILPRWKQSQPCRPLRHPTYSLHVQLRPWSVSLHFCLYLP